MRPSFTRPLYRFVVHRLALFGVALVAVVVVGAFVGLVLLHGPGAPSVSAVKSFDARTVATKGRTAGREIDDALAAIDFAPSRVRARSDVDACYADQQQEGFASGYYNKTCFRRKLLLLDAPIAPSAMYAQIRGRLDRMWSFGPERPAGVCFGFGVLPPRDPDPRGVTLDLVVRPADPRRVDRSFTCLLPIDQVAGVLTLRSPATARNLAYNRRSLFDDTTEQAAIVRDRYPTLVRIGLTVQYYSERIR